MPWHWVNRWMLFGLLIITESDLERGDTLFTLVTITVFLSVVAHGVSAVPLASRYSRSTSKPRM